MIQTLTRLLFLDGDFLLTISNNDTPHRWIEHLALATACTPLSVRAFGMWCVSTPLPVHGARRVFKIKSDAANQRAATSTRAPRIVDVEVPTVAHENENHVTNRGRRDTLFATLATTLATVVSLTVIDTSSANADTTDATDPSCSSCEGAVDGTLGRCEGFGKRECRSTFDDRPPFFAAPWEFGRDVFSTEQALEAIAAACKANGGKLELNDVQVGYLRASFGSKNDTQSKDGAVVVEFLARGENDAVCEVRGTVRGSNVSNIMSLPGTSEVERTLERIRRYLGWAEVPVLRNRTSKILGYFDTPFDDFGPVPPPTMDYNGMRGDALSDELM